MPTWDGRAWRVDAESVPSELSVPDFAGVPVQYREPQQDLIDAMAADSTPLDVALANAAAIFDAAIDRLAAERAA